MHFAQIFQLISVEPAYHLRLMIQIGGFCAGEQFGQKLAKTPRPESQAYRCSR